MGIGGLYWSRGGGGRRIALLWSLRLRGSSWLHVKSTTFLFLKYLVHNRSCNHDPTKFAPGTGIGGGLWVSLQGQRWVIQALVDFFAGFLGILGPVVMAGSMVEIGGYILSWLLPKARHAVSHRTKHHIST